MLTNGHDCEKPEYIAPITKNLTYNGSSQELLTAGSTNDGTIYYSIDNSTWSTTVPSGTNAGSYTVYWKLAGDEGYCDIRSKINVTIAKADTTYTAPTAKSLTYNGSAQALLNAGAVTGGTIQYSDDNTTWGTSMPTATNANTYASYWRIVGDSNHNDKVSASISTTIAKVTPTVVAPTAKVLTYNGSAQELVNAGSTDYGTLQYKVSSDSWSTSIPTRTRGGSYTIQYRVVGDSNINDVAAQSVQCSINEKQVTATVTLSQTAYTYNGSPCEPSVTVSDGGVVIDPSEYTVTYSNNVNAGTGTVTISDNVGGDYEVIGSSTFTINKVTPTVTVPTAKVLTYNGSAQELVNAGSTDYGTLKYSIDGNSYSTSIPSGTNVASYTVYYKVDGDSNINDIASNTVNVTISKAESSLSFTVTNVTIEVGETSSNVVTVNAGDGTVTYSSNDTSVVTVDNNGSITGISVGNAVITANISSTSNYNSASTSYTSYCIDGITAKYNITSTSYNTRILSSTTNVSKVYIDGVEQPSVIDSYKFSSKGEHTARYILRNTSIGNSAFTNCVSLTSINVPNGVTSIGYDAFNGCYNLTSCTIGSGVTSIGERAFRNCSRLTSVTIPDSVTSIDEYAFYNCDELTSINIPSGVTSISEAAFYGCYGLTSCTIGSGVTSIDEYAFYNCSSLTSINIPSGVTSIGNNAFYRCYGFTSIEIPDSVTSIGDYAFNGCTNITSIDIPNNVTSIGKYAFRDCSGLTSCTIGSGVTSISERAFFNCYGLTSIGPVGSGASVEIPNSVTSIGGSAFAFCSGLTSVTIPDGVTKIDSSVFGNCSGMTSCTIGSGVTYIGYLSFTNCTSLTSITIPSGVTSIIESAFSGCSGLISIIIEAMIPPTLQNNAFADTNNCPIYVPCDSVDTYKAASGWSTYSDRIQAIP